MCKDWLWQLFQHEGRVVDANVSYKERQRTTNLFGFVRFLDKKKAEKAIQNMHGLEVRGCKLSVHIAAFGKRSQTDKKGFKDPVRVNEPKVPWATTDGRTFKEALVGTNGAAKNGKEPKKMHGRATKVPVKQNTENEEPNNSVFIIREVCNEKKEWLKHSCVSLLKNPADVSKIATKLAYLGLGISKIRDIGSYKFSITFQTQKDMKKSLEDGRTGFPLGSF